MLSREDALAYGLSFPDTYQDAPFHDTNWQLVRYKGNDKAFLWTYERDGYINLNVKVDPDKAFFWRDVYKSVIPGYHQNKEHWNTIILDGSVPEDDIRVMIAESYDLISDSPSKRIYEAVKRIPKGCVATYAQVAEAAGNRKMARAVGNALHRNPDPENIPCFRVVNAKGELADEFVFGGAGVQAKLLEAEGIEVVDGKVDLRLYQCASTLVGRKKMLTEEITFEKKNGQKIAAKVYRPDGDEKRYPTVIFSHGFGSNYRELQHHGDGFAEEGIVCVFFDFCGGGMESRSSGSMQDMTIMTEVDDLEFVMDEVEKLSYVDSENLFLQGESMGGFVSAYVAAEHPEKVRGLVLWYPAFVIPDDAKIRFENGSTEALGLPLGPEYSMVAKDIDIYGKISSYSAPVCIIHGDRDPIVPISYSERAAETYDNAALTTIAGAGHGFDGEDSRHARELSLDFIKDVMG